MKDSLQAQAADSYQPWSGVKETAAGALLDSRLSVT